MKFRPTTHREKRLL